MILVQVKIPTRLKTNHGREVMESAIKMVYGACNEVDLCEDKNKTLFRRGICTGQVESSLNYQILRNCLK